MFVPGLVLVGLGFGVVLPFFVVFDRTVAPPPHGVGGVVSGVPVTLGFRQRHDVGTGIPLEGAVTLGEKQILWSRRWLSFHGD